MPILLDGDSNNRCLPNGRAIPDDRSDMGSTFKVGMGHHRPGRSDKPSKSYQAMESKELIIAIVTILGSGAAFKFYEMVVKTKKEAAREQREEARAENPETMFREDLLKRVEEMSVALQSAQGKILGLTQKVAELETENRYLQREIDILKRK